MTRKEQAIAAWAQSDWAEVATFLGPNSISFRSAYEKGRDKAAKSGNGIAFTWSWPALVFGFAWFAYRKQWVIAALLIVLPILASFLIESRSGLVGIAIALAMMAKSLLIQDAVTKIARIKAAGGGHDQIAAAGGVSIPGGIAGGILWALATTSAIATIVRGSVGG